MLLALLTAFTSISAQAAATDAVKLVSSKPAAALTCAEMKQNILANLDFPTNGGVQQAAKFSIVNLRVKAYSDVCGGIDQELAEKIFQSI